MKDIHLAYRLILSSSVTLNTTVPENQSQMMKAAEREFKTTQSRIQKMKMKGWILKAHLSVVMMYISDP
jgi:predicted ATPase